MLVMTKFDLLDDVEKAAVNDNIFFYHPSSYGFHGDVFSPDVRHYFTVKILNLYILV